MNVGQLRKAIADLPANMPVLVQNSELSFWEDCAAYLAPGHVDRRFRTFTPSEGHVDTASPIYANYENITVLVIGEYYTERGVIQEPGVVRLTPEDDRPGVVDGELAPLAIEEGSKP